MNINVSSNINQVTRHLNDIQRKQIPFALAGALNDVAFKAGPKGRVLGKEADKTFKGGAPAFTQRAFKVNKANKKNLTAEVFVDKVQQRYLRFQIKGGIRFPDRSSGRKPGGQKIRMVARYIDKAQYRPLFPFAETTQGVVFGQQGGITERFRKRLAYALKTAKKPRR